jgi:hypothetical protein
MRYVSIFKSPERDTPPTEHEIAVMEQYIQERARAGVLLSAEGCMPSATGARIRRSGDKISVTDGPFTEAKEVLGGLALFQVNSREEAIEEARKFLEVAGTDGECEIRQLYEVPALEPA